MKLRDLPIGVLLAFGRGAILTLVLLLGALAWLQADALWAQTRGLYEHPLLVRRAVDQIRADILQIDSALQMAIDATSQDEIEHRVQAIDSLEADAHRQFSIVYDRYLGPTSEISAAEQVFVEWKTIRDETLSLLRSGEKEQAELRSQRTGIGGQHVERMLASLQALSVYADTRADQFYQDAMLGHSALQTQLVIAYGGVLVAATIISLFLLRGIRDPLRELTDVTERYRAGERGARSGYLSHNEFGRLSASFNSLADTVQAEIQRQTAAAEVAEVMLREIELRPFSQALLGALLRETGSQLGAVYLLNESKTAFEYCQSIGLSAGAKPTFTASVLEGEFGPAVASRQIQHIAEIPADTHFTFATVGGEFRAREILTIPILDGDEVVAIISLASIRQYTARSLRLVSDLLPVLTARMNGVLTYRQTLAYAQRVELQNRELESQTKELGAQAAELSTQNVELEMQKRQLDNANRMKSTFLSNMSHELRTPLNSVIALAGVLGRRLRGAVPEEEYGYLEVIQRNGRHLLDLINGILDLSRIEAGHERAEVEQFSVGVLVDEIVATLEPQAKQKGIKLVTEVGAQLSPGHIRYREVPPHTSESHRQRSEIH